ncbi:hypothetical protein V6N11_074963 [Hibiscus sabdariffa]|uniref:Uncharacterized protein n=1 Tax=Hibiscus sabdariffa TaxID=183260 RepID=A0ABR2R5B7_9ROSI
MVVGRPVLFPPLRLRLLGIQTHEDEGKGGKKGMGRKIPRLCMDVRVEELSSAPPSWLRVHSRPSWEARALALACWEVLIEAGFNSCLPLGPFFSCHDWMQQVIQLPCYSSMEHLVPTQQMDT